MTKETRDLTTLQFAPYNSNKMDEHGALSLDQSLAQFGDLSGIIFNVRTGHLVGGEHRLKSVLKLPGAHAEVSERLAQPDKKGSVAWGFVVVPDTDLKLSYREVEWDPETEMAASLAANLIHGKQSEPLLVSITNQLAHATNQNLLKLTGLTQAKTKQLLDKVNGPASQPKPPEQIYSQPHATYQLGQHRIFAGASELKFVDAARKAYAQANGQGHNWQEFTPLVVTTQSTGQPSV